MSFKYKQNKYFDNNNSFNNNKYHNRINVSFNNEDSKYNKSFYHQNSLKGFNPFQISDYRNYHKKNNFQKTPVVVKLRGGTKIILSSDREDY